MPARSDSPVSLLRHQCLSRGYGTAVSALHPVAPVDIDVAADVAALTETLIDIPSESGSEQPLADAVARALGAVPTLNVERIGNSLVAATHLGRSERVVIAGHLDTVPSASNLPHRREGERIWGLGSVDMKGGLAVSMRLAAHVSAPTRDVTFVYYDCEEIHASRNGLARIVAQRPDLLECDFAILMEPSSARVEAGCQGTLRIELTARGRRAHSARSWMGHNAIHDLAPALTALASYRPATVRVAGLDYREGLNAVAIRGGVAGNVIPDAATVTVNYRYAPSRTEEQALAHFAEVFPGFDLQVIDTAPAGNPGLDRAAVQSFVAATGQAAAPKYGWTDVARFSALGIPAVNYGPGDPALAHSPDESVSVAELTECEAVLRNWLTGS